jgi:hypothetical protein
MFLQVFHGQVGDGGAARTCLGEWMETLDRPDSGWLGTTAGVTADGRSITLTRFASAEAAEPTRERDRWSAQMAALSSAPVTVESCPEVMTQLRGDTGDAGFVQVVQGRIADLERLQHALEAASEWQTVERDDIIGGLLGLHGDGRFTQAVYFTSEVAARSGEQRDPPAEAGELDLLVDGLTFLDLPRPWAYLPR